MSVVHLLHAQIGVRCWFHWDIQAIEKFVVMADERKTSELLLVDQGLECVPAEIAGEKGPSTTSLNVSENTIKTGKNMDKFTVLDTLVLDKNGMSDLVGFPRLPTVTTLWFNNNLVVDLATFLDHVVECFPALTYLSFMRNPASPSLLCASEEDAAALRRYRLYVIYRIPKLTFLDSSPVSKEERSEALKRGEFLVPRRPKVVSKPVYEPETLEHDRKRDDARPTATHVPEAQRDTRRPSAYLGLGTSNYDGRHSEGNRFIGDDHL